MAMIKRALFPISVLVAFGLSGCGSSNADTDTNTAGLKPPLPAAKPGTVVDPPDPSKSEGANGVPGTP
jgi:hypothetical protein